ncbi:hypothetical protein FRC03_011063 [Tulasnella sp. 419]|nr:hypothetical protein FRC03_011063 [Tulasnella sp. 419]
MGRTATVRVYEPTPSPPPDHRDLDGDSDDSEGRTDHSQSELDDEDVPEAVDDDDIPEWRKKQIGIALEDISLKRHPDPELDTGNDDGSTFLRPHPRQSSPDGSVHWVRKAVVAVDRIGEWFDVQKNDYGKKKDAVASSVVLKWVGHPGSSPRDFRARRFDVVWNDDVVNHSQKQVAIENGLVVANSLYICSGKHRIVPSPAKQAKGSSNQPKSRATRCRKTSKQGARIPDPEADDDDEDGHEEGEKEGGEEAADQAGRKSERKKSNRKLRWHHCTGIQAKKGEVCKNVKILVEIYAHDLANAYIYQWSDHADANPTTQPLEMSRRLHNMIEEHFSNQGASHGAKVSEVMKMLPKMAANRSPAYPFPAWRKPNKLTIINMFPASRARLRLARDPFPAIDLLAEQEPKKVYCYKSYNEGSNARKSKFMCGLKDDFTLDSLILYAKKNGLAMDSSWRHKNEN